MRGFRIWMAVALVGIAGCGGGGNGSSNEGAGTSTPTPLATVTPTPTTSLVLTVSSTTDLAGASFTIGYEAARGSFTGSGAQAQCRLGSNDTLAVNDDDAGTLRVALLPGDPLQNPALALPTTFTCSFDQTGGTVTTQDLRIGSKTVGVVAGSGVVVEGDGSRLDVR